MRIKLDDKKLDIYLELKKGESGEKIAKKFGLSRVAVWKFVKKLEEFGYIISRKGGYRILSIPDPSPFDMALACRKMDFVKDFYFFEKIDSTNKFAKDVSDAIVFAKKQSSGRGRLGRKWESEEGGLYMSLSLNLKIPISEIPKLTLLSGLAVCRALKDYKAKIKWPNDVIVEGRKVCGILSEFIGEELSSKVVIGIGVNVKNEIPKWLENKAIALKEISPIEINEVFSKICFEINSLLKDFLNGKWDEIVEELREKSDTIGREVKISVANREYRGLAVGIDSDGALIIERDGKLERIISGECFYTNYDKL